MIKKTLYATWANGRGFVKQAFSISQFVGLCVRDEAMSGYTVPPNGKHFYKPDYIWDEDHKSWRALYAKNDFRKKLPWQK